MPPLFKYLPSPDLPAWPPPLCGFDKPLGWWLSVDDAWEMWCHEMEFRLERVAWRRPVKLTPDARVTMFSNRSPQFKAFTDRYQGPDRRHRVPDWKQVATDMDVLILFPWERPLQHPRISVGHVVGLLLGGGANTRGGEVRTSRATESRDGRRQPIAKNPCPACRPDGS